MNMNVFEFKQLQYLKRKEKTQSDLINAVKVKLKKARDYMMMTKEYLGQAYRLDQRINSKLEQVASLNDLATKVTSTLTDMPKNPNRATATMEVVIVKIIDLQSEINNDIDCLVDLKREIVSAIKTVANTEHQMLLEKRYLSFKTWEQIAVDMNYSIQHIYRIRGRAIAEISTFE